MGSDFLRPSSIPCELDKMGTQKISVSNQTKRLQCTNFDPDSFIVDVERLSLLTDKDTTTANSRPTLQRSLSRKVSQQKGVENMFNPGTGNEKDTGVVASIFGGDSTPEKPMVVTVETTTKDQPISPHIHHQIAIMTGNIRTRDAGDQRRSWSEGKRFSFRRSSSSWTTVDPRMIFFFFATLSCVGTILLICFTLSIGRQSGVDSNALN